MLLHFAAQFFSRFPDGIGRLGVDRAKYQVKQPNQSNGQVWLIGAGPGDAELLTLKAHRLIQQADVVMYDWLVNPDILQMIPGPAERVFVGKKCGQHSMQQADICQLMVDTALQGKNIVRLKGGDPAIFGRLAEECDILTEHKIDFAMVPGITSASGMSAYSGIPLTHRDCAQSVRFITAHTKKAEQEPDWSCLVPKPSQSMNETLVFYMGLSRLETISQRLIQHGMSATMPVAVIDQATLSAQRVCTGTLADISETVGSANFQGPALIIVGEVVTKRQAVNLTMLESPASIS